MAIDQGTENRSDPSLGRRTIQHILDHHHAFLRRVLPILEGDLDQAGGTPGQIEARILFSDLRTELELHMSKEEQILFPLVVELEQALEAGRRSDRRGCGIEGPIEQMEREHRKALSILARLEQLAPTEMTDRVQQGLEELIADLRTHIRLEDEQLFPLARRLASTASA